VVVAVGLTVVEPVADVDVNVPGVMAMVVAPVVTQLNVLVEPELMLVGFAVNDVMVGFVTGGVVLDEPDEVPQPMRAAQARKRPSAKRFLWKVFRPQSGLAGKGLGGIHAASVRRVHFLKARILHFR
jgi:hypothetical protein